jgi:uncharacterized protein (DUF2384 family)
MPKVRVVSNNDLPVVALKKPKMSVIVASDNAVSKAQPLTSNEVKVRQLKKRYAAVTTAGMGMNRTGADVMDAVTGNFYSPQLSTDFLEKPQNLRERRAFYRLF